MDHTVDDVGCEQATGNDSTGSITVILGPAFHVEDLSISNAWRKKLSLSAFTAALHEALGGAAAESIQHASSTPVIASAELPAELLNDLPEAEADNATRRLSELCSSVLDEVSERIDALSTAWNAEHAGTDDQRRVQATVDLSGMPTNVTIDEAWLTSVNVQRLTNAVREAIDRAQESAAAARSSLRTAPHRSGDRLRALSDPTDSPCRIPR